MLTFQLSIKNLLNGWEAQYLGKDIDTFVHYKMEAVNLIKE